MTTDDDVPEVPDGIDGIDDIDEFDDWAEEGWTEDEIDALVRDSLGGEIGEDRFEELLEQAIVVAQQPQAPPQAQKRANARAAAGKSAGKNAGKTPRANVTTTRWLMAAAAVLLVGFIAFTARPKDDDLQQAGDQPRSSTSGAAQGGPVQAPPSPCELESGGGPIQPGDPLAPALSERTFRCEIDASAPGPTSTVLFTDDSLIKDVVPVAGSPSTPCIDIQSSSPELAVVPGECSGEGMRAASAVPGTYEIEFRVLTCTVAEPVGGCGLPGTDYVGRIVVEVGE